MRRICAVITARPSYARIKTALLAMAERPDIDLKIIVGASGLLEKYGRVVDVIRADGLTVDAEVFMVLDGDAPVVNAKTTGIGIVEMSSALAMMKPDAVVTIADRFETMATAVAASYMNIPLIHVQGGEITGSIDEKVRHAITKLADIHMTASQQARDRVINLGEDPERVFCTGCPSIDIVREVSDTENEANIRSELMAQIKKGVGAAIDLDSPFIVAMQHPVTYEWREAGQQIEKTLAAIRDTGTNCFMFWPNVDSGSQILSKSIRTFREKNDLGNFRFFRNLPPRLFLYLLKLSKCLVGNSSVGIREAAFLGLPVVNIGSRQAGRDRGANVVDVEHDVVHIATAVKEAITIPRWASDPIYGDGWAGQRIADLLAKVPLTTEKRLVSKV